MNRSIKTSCKIQLKTFQLCLLFSIHKEKKNPELFVKTEKCYQNNKIVNPNISKFLSNILSQFIFKQQPTLYNEMKKVNSCKNLFPL